MNLYKIIDKYRARTYAVLRADSPEKAIAKYRRISGDTEPVIAFPTKW